MKRNILSIVFLLGMKLLSAQECDKTLSGSVIDFHDGVSLEGATITFNNTTVTTNDKGEYTIKNLCATSYAFTISHERCNAQVVTVNLNEISKKDFYLEHHLNELQEVKVSGKDKTKTSSAQEETINKSVLEKYSSASLGDALREITGVSSLNTGSTIVKPIIQGLSGSRILIMNNGVRMQDMEWGEEHAPNVDINTAGSVTVVKGASALKYGGDAIGGTIIMEPTRVPLLDTLYGKTLLTGATNGRGGTLSSELIKGYKNGWFGKAQGTIKRFGDLEAPDYILSNSGVYEKGLSLSFGKNKFEQGWDLFYSFYDAEIAVLASSHIGNIDDLIASINGGQPDIIRDFTYEILNPKQEITHHLGKLRYYRRFEELGKWTTQYDIQRNQRFEFDIRRTAELNERPSIDLQLTTQTLTSDFYFDATSDYTVETGLLVRYQDNVADALNTGVRRLIPDYERYDIGMYLAGEFTINESLIADVGIRYDFSRIEAKKFYLNSRWNELEYETDFSEFVIDRDVIGSQILVNPLFDYHNISATAGLQYSFEEGIQFRFNYSLSQRAPNPSELFSDGLHHSAARIELGDLRIDQETAHKFSASLQGSNEKWRWEISPYINIINDYILLEPVDAELTLRGSFPVWEYRQTDAQLIGIDASMQVNWFQNWQTDHTFSLVKGYETDTNIALINMPAPSITNKVTFTKENWFHLKTSLQSSYVFRQNEFPPNIEVFSIDAREDVFLEINTPPDAYHLLDLDTSIEFKLGKKNSIKTGVAIRNLFDTKYRNYLNRLRYYADDLGRNFLLTLTFNY